MPVQDDPRTTAFYLTTLRQLGRTCGSDGEAMERYRAVRQLDGGAWRAWPGGRPDVELTAVCAMALEGAATSEGERAEAAACAWLEAQPVPRIDGFWFGMLAMNGDRDWSRVPYLSPRMVMLPTWLRPNLLRLCT